MKLFLSLFIGLFLQLAGGTLQAGGVLQLPRPVPVSQVPDEVLVRLRADAAPVAVQRLTAPQGRVLEPIADGLARLRLTPGETVADAVSRLADDPDVVLVQPNYVYRAQRVPNDPDYGRYWGLNNAGQAITGAVYAKANPGTPGRDISAEAAWDISTDCSASVVAVLDTGVDYTRPELAGNMWDGGTDWPHHGWDFVGAGDSDPRPVGGGEHHGTHVAGTIAAAGNNATGGTGVCWQARLMAVRVLDENGIGTTADLIEGIRFAVDHGAKVINMSLGSEQPYDTAFADAIDYARQHDVLVVVAAGNGGLDGVGDDVQVGDDGFGTVTRVYPCAFPHDNLLCVAALDQNYDLADFSNYGTMGVDLGAPGTNIRSTVPGQEWSDDFSGWTPVPATGGWTSLACDVGYGPWNMLVDPPDWCSLNAGNYAQDAADVIYRTFDLSAASAAVVSYYAFFDVASGDAFNVAYDASGNNPFAGGGVLLQSPVSGSSLPSAQPFTHDLSSCLTSNCALGFQLQANGDTTTATGVGLFGLYISTLEPGSSRYAVYNGTSMASPHVAGIAALVRAFNPAYTYLDTREALVNGGDPAVGSFAGKSENDRSANAEGALRYLAPPQNLTATLN